MCRLCKAKNKGCKRILTALNPNKLEYTGSDFAADMAKMAADTMTQKWWDVCIPCQESLPDKAENEWWADMEEVFHCD